MLQLLDANDADASDKENVGHGMRAHYVTYEVFLLNLAYI